MTVLYALIALVVLIILVRNWRAMYRRHRYDLWLAKHLFDVEALTRLATAIQAIGVSTQRATEAFSRFSAAFQKAFPDPEQEYLRQFYNEESLRLRVRTEGNHGQVQAGD